MVMYTQTSQHFSHYFPASIYTEAAHKNTLKYVCIGSNNKNKTKNQI